MEHLCYVLNTITRAPFPAEYWSALHTHACTQQKLHELKLNETIVSIEDKLNDLNKKIDTEAKSEVCARGITTLAVPPVEQDANSP